MSSSLLLSQKPQVSKRFPYANMGAFLEQELPKIDRARMFMYKQRDRLISRQLQFGIISELACQNVPKVYEISELESHLLKARLVVGGEPLLYSFSTQNMIVLDNKANRSCGAAVICTFPEYETLLMIGFQQSDLPIDYQTVVEQLLFKFKDMRILENQTLDLDYIPPQVQVIKKTNFQSQLRKDPKNPNIQNNYIRIEDYFLQVLQDPRPFDVEEHRFGLVIILNPLYPTFEYSLQLAAQIQECYKLVNVVVCIKGATTQNHLQMCSKSPYYKELNSVEEHNRYADDLLGKNNAFYQLFDMFPQTEKKPAKKFLLNKKVTFADTLRDYIDENDYMYNSRCDAQPVKLIQSENLFNLIKDLELSFNKQIDKKLFSAEEESIILYGIQHKIKRFSDSSKPYSCVFLSRSINCQKQINALSEFCNVYVLLPGVWSGTLKTALQQNPVLQQVSVIFDTQNLFRIADDLFQKTGDHIILFDENAIQMAVDFEVKELGKMIENDLKMKQAVEKQPVNEDSEVDEFKGGLMGKL
ncbi:Conserved_hypothetical protein [Hexamita inflata]|uniref:Uncharacterized protein n=1 Tax=Hexamita inflata TaxID=28002 RepID=A0ABP1HHK0_9EUKA